MSLRGKHLGEFEELVLLVVAALEGNAYAVSVKLELEEKSKRSVSISAVHSTLYRCEKKGLLSSELGQSSRTRGGKSKRLFRVTAYGYKTLAEAESLRQSIRTMIPKFQ